MTNAPPSSAVWNDANLQNPHVIADKRARVQAMFNAIAPSYDLNNRLHSLWMDQLWRRRAVKLAQVKPADAVIDVACGTGDLSLKFAAAKPASVLGIDFTYAMLPIARHKASAHHSAAAFACGDATRLPLPDASADVVSIAFGIRNVAVPADAIREFFRVLRPGGRLVILEFSLPKNALLRAVYNFYFRQILPRTATLISRDKTGAYRYLPQSVNTFLDPIQLSTLLSSAGFSQVTRHSMTLGACICYKALKI